MNRFSAALVVGAAAILIAAPACSQQPAGRGLDLMRIATQESVQADLKLSSEQTSVLKEAHDKQREAMGSFRDMDEDKRRAMMQEFTAANDKLLVDTLTDEQMARLKQIAIQANGTRAAESPDVAAALRLTDEQKGKIAEIEKDLRSSAREAYGQTTDRAVVSKKMAELRNAATQKMLALFTDEQKTKWNELTGAPFKGEIQSSRGYGGGFRGGSRRGGGRPPGE